MIEKYRKYVEQFNQSDPRIVYKWEHSLRVMEKMQKLSLYLHQSKEEYELATIIGLFHDYGRFYQVENFNTYQDKIFDHGDYGAEQLILKRQIKNFVTQEVEEQVIYDAIKNHNKYAIDSNLQNKSLLFSKMIRDADKVDILESLSKGAIELDEDESTITPEVKETFFNHQQLLSSLRRTKSDRMIGFLCLIYDLNYDWSYEYLKKYRIIDHIYDQIKDKKLFEPYFKEIKHFIEKEKEV
ncbi:MAG TPA: HD domain-containing protein [Candidatus Pelethosoma merdigallinarum]|nr:HD domain-containing protein [Candidatus Pelethosoma merdigallinarum]